MIEKNSTSTQAVSQENITKIADKFTYDLDQLDKFLLDVFHVEQEADENILCWAANSNVPSFPSSETELLNKLKRVPVGKALYFATSTTKPDPIDGRLLNRKALFKRFYVLVLDDIGTKIPVSKIPAELKPTYIIESSAGNYQYGYVMEQPIDVLEQAEALVQLVYEAGLSDNGGKMATKIVRLPDGINGKKGDKGQFHVRLKEWTGKLWMPEDILNILDIGVTWDQVVTDAKAVAQKRARKAVGAMAFADTPIHNIALDGTVDPVLEAMYENDMVVQESNEWITIRCPWGHDHTTGDDTAGYSPIGRGTPEFFMSRSFKCFHEHCASRTTDDFLTHMRVNFNVIAPRFESPEVMRLKNRYVASGFSNGVFDLNIQGKATPMPMAGLKLVQPENVTIFKDDGTTAQVKAVSLFADDTSKITVAGVTYDPSTPAPIVYDKKGNRYVNEFTAPDWGDGDYDEAEVQYFLNFITYLIPTKAEMEYFLDWFAAKCQDLTFRGAGLLMIAKAQGTGRTTLAHILSTLLGRENCEKVPFDVLSGSGNFNEWQTKSLIVTDETLAVGSHDSYYKVYEKIKERIDVAPTEVRVNPKFGMQRTQMTYSSFLLLSNHENAMSVAENDRRIYVITNPTVPASPEYFTELNAWLSREDDNGNPVWAKHLWRYFRNRKINLTDMTKPAPLTGGKTRMAHAAKSDIDRVLSDLMAEWPSGVFCMADIKSLLAPHALRLGDNARNVNKIIEKILMDKTVTVGHKVFKHKGKVKRFRAFPTRVQPHVLEAESLFDFKSHLKLNESHEANMKQKIIEILDANDL